MAGPYTRFSFLFQLTTAPNNREVSISHTGGWSEQHVWPGVLPINHERVIELASRRAALLPSAAQLVGIRKATFTTSGNKIVPGGSQTSNFRRPGGTWVTDLPQVSLSLSCIGEGGGNTSRQVLRCVPDAFMVKGEYEPSSAFTTALGRYTQALVDHNWGFMGRDLSSPKQAVFFVDNNTIKTTASLGGGVDSYVRLLNVRDSNTQQPLDGIFRITGIAGTVYTVEGLPAGAEAHNSGFARLDGIVLVNIGEVLVGRACVRKIGRPFESYRGRASRRTR